ncbi:hypothetical protein BE11_06810 [Sorangium cellulosum]|nr:hypothetical protein BE11_06810 [Sorangium cellulosum]
MKKILIAGTIGLFALAAAAPAAQAAGHEPGNRYGAVVMECRDKSVGEAIQNGRAAHPGAKMTAKTIAMSVHCAD